MIRPTLIECSFLIPVRRDANMSDGDLHDAAVWEWLTDELWDQFGGATIHPGLYTGFYRDPETGDRVTDESRRYEVAIARTQIVELRRILIECCAVFRQKIIYLSVGGKVEFVGPPGN